MKKITGGAVRKVLACTVVLTLLCFFLTQTRSAWAWSAAGVGGAAEAKGSEDSPGAVERVPAQKKSTGRNGTLKTVLLIAGAAVVVGVALWLLLSKSEEVEPYSENFDSGRAEGWKNNGIGIWGTLGGIYTFNGLGTTDNEAYSWYDRVTYTDFTYEARFYNWGDQGLAFRGNPETGDWYVFYVWGNTQDWSFFRYTNDAIAAKIVFYQHAAALKVYPEWNQLKVVAKGSSFTFYANGVQIGTATDSTLTSGKIGFQVRNHEGNVSQYDDVSVSPGTASASTGHPGKLLLKR